MATDAEDLRSAADGNTEALRALVARWKRPVYSVFERTREPNLAAEAAVSVFSQLPSRGAENDGGRTFPEQLFAMVWERMSGEPAISAAEAAASRRVSDSTGSRAGQLRAAVAALPPRERALFLFTRIASLSVDSAASAMDITRVEARDALASALDQMRVSLGPIVELPSMGSTGTQARKGPAA